MLELVFDFDEEAITLLFAHKVNELDGTSNVRLNGDYVVRFDAEPCCHKEVIALYHMIKAKQRFLHRIVEVKEIKMFPVENRYGETHFVRLKYKCTKVTLEHPIGGRTVITHTLREGRNNFIIKTPYNVKIERCHPDNFMAIATKNWGTKIARQIMNSI